MSAKTHFDRTGNDRYADSGFYRDGQRKGNVLYVDSVTGTSAGPGWTPETAYATLGQAIASSYCRADSDDIIYLMPGHTETFSTSATHVTFSKAGVTVEGIGSGAGRPTFTFSHTGATWSITAAGVTLRNLLLVTGVDSVVTYCSISGNDVLLEDIETRDTTDIEVISDFTITGDRPTVRRLLKNGYTAGNANARVLSMAGVDRALIEDCRFITAILTGVINFITTACTAITVRNCVFRTAAGGTKHIVDTIGGSTWSNDNSFDMTGAAPLNGDGFRYATKTSTSALTTGTLFNWTGSIEIIRIIGRVTTVIQSQATTVKLSVVCDALTAVDICSTKDINAFAVGSLLQITGTAANAMNGTTAVGVTAPEIQVNPIVATCVTSGTITVTYGAASTGAIVWEVVWRPISAAATLVAA